jgi:hypothetical protein
VAALADAEADRVEPGSARIVASTTSRVYL